MDDWLTQKPISKGEVDRAEEFARDLARGVDEGLWTTYISYTGSGPHLQVLLGVGSDKASFIKLAEEKWDSELPSLSLMASLGFMVHLGKSDYRLTEKALALIDELPEPPAIFISYKRDQSSAFGLYIEARLKFIGVPNPFIDKNLVAGEPWHGQLESIIQESEVFICLIGPQTLSSEWVQKEIRWAAQYDSRIISIWHDCRVSDDWSAIPTDIMGVLSGLQVIEVPYTAGNQVHSAMDYETAVSRLLNALGYPTY